MVNAYTPLLPDSAPHTTTTLSYYHPPANGETPYTMQYNPSGGNGLPSNVIPRQYSRPIYDLRQLVDEDREAETDINTTGFQIVPKQLSATSMKYEDWENEDTIRKRYYSEVETLLKNVTGASKVIIFDHTIRRGEKVGAETADTPENRKPVQMVHVDQTVDSGRRRVYRHAGDDADRLLRGQAQLINLWRPLRGPVKDVPLAYADARTLKKDELIKSRLIYKPPTPEGETLRVNYSDEHRWYYLSNMQPNEAVLLKCWDNTPDGGNPTPHSAFNDERYFGKEGVELRQSIEIRALVFHEPEE